MSQKKHTTKSDYETGYANLEKRERNKKLVGNHLKCKRILQGQHTQEQFAEYLGIESKTYQKYEQGEILPSLGQINDLRKKLYSLPPFEYFPSQDSCDNKSLNDEIKELKAEIRELKEIVLNLKVHL